MTLTSLSCMAGLSEGALSGYVYSGMHIPQKPGLGATPVPCLQDLNVASKRAGMPIVAVLWTDIVPCSPSQALVSDRHISSCTIC